MTKSPAPIEKNGWFIFAHPAFLDQLESLVEEVEKHKRRDPANYTKKNCTKRLAAIWKLVTEAIPADPGAQHFRQGKTLGDQRKHWFRGKFFQQYRLFYRFDTKGKVIVLAWVNDEKSLRAYGSKTDAYVTFKGMLNDGNPPDSYDNLLKEAKSVSVRFNNTFQKGTNKMLNE